MLHQEAGRSPEFAVLLYCWHSCSTVLLACMQMGTSYQWTRSHSDLRKSCICPALLDYCSWTELSIVKSKCDWCIFINWQCQDPWHLWMIICILNQGNCCTSISCSGQSYKSALIEANQLRLALPPVLLTAKSSSWPCHSLVDENHRNIQYASNIHLHILEIWSWEQ